MTTKRIANTGEVHALRRIKLPRLCWSGWKPLRATNAAFESRAPLRSTATRGAEESAVHGDITADKAEPSAHVQLRISAHFGTAGELQE